MKERYITKSKIEIRAMQIIIAILIILNQIICLVSMSIETKYKEVVKEKENLEILVDSLEIGGNEK